MSYLESDMTKHKFYKTPTYNETNYSNFGIILLLQKSTGQCLFSAAKSKNGPQKRKNGPKTDPELNEKQTFNGPVIGKKRTHCNKS